MRDLDQSPIPSEDYRKLYFIGHYNPRGNHFFAYSIRDKIVCWLDPKPITYRDPGEEASIFKATSKQFGKVA